MNETLLDISRQFWEAMEHADEVGMRACAHPDCNFVLLASPANWTRKSNFTPVGPFNLRILPSTVRRLSCLEIPEWCLLTAITVYCWTGRKPLTTLW